MENNETISILSLFDIDLSTTNIAKNNTRCYPLNNLFILADTHEFKITYSVFANETLYVGSCKIVWCAWFNESIIQRKITLEVDN